MPTEYRIRENKLEKRWRESVKKLGCEPLKFASYYSTGWPDRFTLSPWGVLYLAEIKRPGEEVVPGSKQEKRIEKARRMGFTVFVINSVESMEAALTHLKIAKSLYADKI